MPSTTTGVLVQLAERLHGRYGQSATRAGDIYCYTNSR